MPTTWTDETRPTTTFTPETKPTTPWSQLNPPGFGLMPFGDPSNSEMKPEMRGFGDSTTKWTNA